MDLTAAQRRFVRIWTLIGLALVVVGLWFLLRRPLAIVAAPIALATIIVYLLNPSVRYLERRRIPRTLGTAAAYLLFLGLTVATIALVGPLLVEQLTALVDAAPQIAAAAQDWVNARLAGLGIEARVNLDLQSASTQEAIAGLVEQNPEEVASLVRGVGVALGILFHGLLTLVLAPIVAFYVLADLPRLADGAFRLLPPESRSEIGDVIRRIGLTVGAYFRGQLLVATFVGVATSIGLALIDLPFWAVVGGATGVFNLIPLLGPFVGGLLGVIVAVTVGGGVEQAIWVVVVMTVVQQIDNHVITPNIVAKTVKVHPVTVILGLLVAGSLFGVLGMFVAIPAIAAAKLITMYLLVTRVPAMHHLTDEGPGLFEPPGETVPAERRRRRRRREDATLVGLAQELRTAWERRRLGESDSRGAPRWGRAVRGAAGRRERGDAAAASPRPGRRAATEEGDGASGAAGDVTVPERDRPS